MPRWLQAFHCVNVNRIIRRQVRTGVVWVRGVGPAAGLVVCHIGQRGQDFWATIVDVHMYRQYG